MADWDLVAIDIAEDILDVSDLSADLEGAAGRRLVDLLDGDDFIGLLAVTGNELEADLTEVNETTTAYFSAPPSYLGKKLASYGGLLTYSIFYSIGTNGSAISAPDVILHGK